MLTPPTMPATITTARRHYYARACIIQRTIGTRAAAGFLRNAGFRMETALALLATSQHSTKRHLTQL